ncbi:MAG TPA: DUF488 domain-containing protein [Nitrospirota bacterium]
MEMRHAEPPLTIFTIGHSTHSIEEFIGMLMEHGIQTVADVRSIPGSRHNPQFNGNELAKSLTNAGIGYVHMAELGGLRHAKKDSINPGWENASFRGFADYMQTGAFEEGIMKLIGTAKRQRTVIMCAEAVPWRCHRSLIADALFVRGAEVLHIMSRKSAKPHAVTSWAEVKGTTITYPKPKTT